MGAKWQRFRVNIPEGYTPDEREALGEIILDFIRHRVQNDGTDKNNRAFKGKYSKAYEKSLNFKIAGKSKGQDIDLTLSGDMLGAMTVLSTSSPNSLLLGFENGTEENARADGNIRGTYGRDTPIKGKQRDFLGIHRDDLAKIIKEFSPAEDAAVNNAGKQLANDLGTSTAADDGEDSND